MRQGIGLDTSEIHITFAAAELVDRFPPVLSPQSCADMLGTSVKTVYCWLESGRLYGAHRRRGKRQLIWRDRAILLVFNGADGKKSPFLLPRTGTPGISLTEQEINKAFASLNGTYPPIASPEHMAKLLGLNRSTVYFWLQQGHFAGAATKRGKRQFFWRNRAINAIFNSPEWSDWNESRESKT